MYNTDVLFQEVYSDKLVFERSKKSFMIKKDLVLKLTAFMDKKYEQAKAKKSDAIRLQREKANDIRATDFDITSARSLIKEHKKVVLETGLLFANEKASNIIKIPKKAIKALLKGFAKKEEKLLFSIKNINEKLEGINADIESLDNAQINEKSKDSFMFSLRRKKYVLEKKQSFVGGIANISTGIKNAMSKTKEIFGGKFVGYNNYFNRIKEHVDTFNDQQGIMPKTTIASLNNLLKEYDRSRKSVLHNDKKANKFSDIRNILSEMSMRYENNANLKAIREAEIYMSEINAIDEETNNYLNSIKEEELNPLDESLELEEVNSSEQLDVENQDKDLDIENQDKELEDPETLSLLEKIEGSIDKLDKLSNRKPSNKKSEKIVTPIIELGETDMPKLDILKHNDKPNKTIEDHSIRYDAPINGFDIEFGTSELIKQINSDYRKSASDEQKITEFNNRIGKLEKSNEALLTEIQNLRDTNKILLEELRKISVTVSFRDHIMNDDMQKKSR